MHWRSDPRWKPTSGTKSNKPFQITSEFAICCSDMITSGGPKWSKFRSSTLIRGHSIAAIPKLIELSSSKTICISRRSARMKNLCKHCTSCHRGGYLPSGKANLRKESYVGKFEVLFQIVYLAQKWVDKRTKVMHTRQTTINTKSLMFVRENFVHPFVCETRE